MSRVFLIIMDSVGIGGAPDAIAYGDQGANTLGHIAAACAAGHADNGRSGMIRLPHLNALGIGGAAQASTGTLPPGLCDDRGTWAVGRETSRGKDTPSGHWELAGAPVTFDWGYFPRAQPAFPAELIADLCREGALPGILGQAHSNGMAVIEEHGETHISTGMPIAYTSADSVFQIAAHEEAFGLERLYDLCRIARRLCDPLNIGRVIARPFVGSPGQFRRTAGRRDFSVAPHMPTLCDRVVDAGRQVIGIGKIADIFAHRGISEILKGADDMALFDQTARMVDEAAEGDLIFANFVEFDSLYGHMRDVAGYARSLEAFDARLPELTHRLRPGDLMIIAADHGNDPTWQGTDHTREQVPILMTGPGIAPGGHGIRGFADVGATAERWLGIAEGPHGRSIL
ncbi:MAG: phosphopentomutase [Pseudomonadota bacterium]